jgi:hypothetical protein
MRPSDGEILSRLDIENELEKNGNEISILILSAVNPLNSELLNI